MAVNIHPEADLSTKIFASVLFYSSCNGCRSPFILPRAVLHILTVTSSVTPAPARESGRRAG